MSVLSERRDRKKWSIDPNGTNWSKDESKFGIKMLEKMGWTKGKGLGANEDGRVDHVKIKHKNDNRGVGCTIKDEQNLVDHQDDFASLLAQLNDHHTDQSEVKTKKGVSNLEKNSKSQKRVHYQKFTRGKDLSNYKEKDLAAIFGKTVSQSAPATPINLSEGEQSDAGSTSSCPERKKKRKKKKSETGGLNSKKRKTGNHITSTMSVQEYFAQRIATLKNKASSGSDLETVVEDKKTIKLAVQESQENEQNVIVSDNKNLKTTGMKSRIKEQVAPEIGNERQSKKKKKSKKKNIEMLQNSNKECDLVMAEPETPKKSKKRKIKESLENQLLEKTNKDSKQ